MTNNNKIAVHDHDKRDSVKWVPGPAQAEIDATPDNRIAVINKHGERIGHVGRGSGAGVAARLIGHTGGIELGTHAGKPAWRETTGVNKAGLAKAVHDASVVASRGSVSDHPDAPKKRVRPRR